MISIAQKIIEQKEGPFDPSKFKDRYEEALKKMIAAKKKGHKPVAAEEPKPSNVIDLMEALKASLAGKKAPSSRSKGRNAVKGKAPTKSKSRKAS